MIAYPGLLCTASFEVSWLAFVLYCPNDVILGGVVDMTYSIRNNDIRQTRNSAYHGVVECD